MSIKNNLFIPNVTKTSTSKNIDISNKLTSSSDTQKNDFKNLLNEKMESQLKGGVELSLHAAKRLEERKIEFDGNEYTKIRDAITKLKSKGGRDSLVVTEKAAYIVDVNKNKIVTAVDKSNMSENVFTKIDSTVFIK